MRISHLAITTSLLATTLSSQAINIIVDYTYDTGNYFNSATADGAKARAAVEAAATRWSNIIGSGNLQAAEINDTNDRRIGFTNPTTGSSYQISGATNQASDSISSVTTSGGGTVGAADEYRSIAFGADDWLLFVGARSQSSTGSGGTGTGVNFSSTFTDPNSHLNRGFNGANPMSGNLPTWGGALSIDTGSSFSFDGDFYSIALHEIGHALGLNIDFKNYSDHVTGATFTGPNALAALNADNGTSATSLSLVSSSNPHFADNGSSAGTPSANQSKIFAAGNPNYTGTVGEGNLQDLLMEPTANFNSTTKRFEVTNVDVGTLQDVGWNVIPEPASSTLLGLGAFTFLLRRRK